MKAAVIAALMIPVFCASAAEYNAEIEAARLQADTWSNTFSQIRTELGEMGVELPAPTPDYTHPEYSAAQGDTVITSEHGMLFDGSNSRIIYLGNVRLIDPRIKLEATEQMHVKLPGISMSSAVDTDNPAAAINPAAQTSAPPAPAADKTTEDAAEEEPEAEIYTGEPVSIIADNAIADTVNNAILLYSPQTGSSIQLTLGKNKVSITSAEGASAPRILADPQGNILMEGADIHLSMADKDGSVTEFRTTGGHVFYHAGSRTLYAPGQSEYNGPQGQLSCTEMLTVLLAAGEEKTPAGKGFMSQFTGMSFDGIDTATARGQVRLTATARENEPAIRIEGDELCYHGKTGAISLTGSKCHLTYADYIINADEGIHLLENGNIELRGQNINGTYTRENQQNGEKMTGTFSAHDHIIFNAETGTIDTLKGITLVDRELNFSCSGPTHLVLARKEGATTPAPKPGMPNLAIAAYRDITMAQANGHVTARRFAPGTDTCIGELQADQVETNLLTGETKLTGAAGQPLIALYNGNRIEASPTETGVASMEMLANGDLKLNGGDIAATLLTDKGTTTARCKDYIRLIRSENRLQTGSATRLATDTGILTTNGPLNVLLLADGSPAPARKGGFPSLRFNYTGIQEATTDSGCTVRTEQGSMQCTGAVRLVMDTEQKSKDKMLGGLLSAVAHGQVAVAGKDKSGRMLRATGDKLSLNAVTGMKVLSGRKVTLADRNNTHEASGKGAAITIDASNNASIKGEKHSTYATRIREQIQSHNPKSSEK